MSTRNIAYISEAKIDVEFTHARKNINVARMTAELGVGGAKTGIEFENIDQNEQMQHAKLDALIRHLDTYSLELEDPNVTLGQWFTFDMTMAYATGHRDSEHKARNDLIFFAGEEEVRRGQPMRLLLCGSAGHARVLKTEPIGREGEFDRGRTGSNTEWIDDIIKSIEGSESQGLPAVSHIHTLEGESERKKNDYDWVASQVHRIILQDHPPAQVAKFKGHAQILWLERNKIFGTLIVATPLYVEFSYKKKSVIKRFMRRLRRG